MHYALTYTYAADYMERRAPLRKEHLALAWAAHERGEFVLGGVFEDPLDGAMFLFRGESPAAAHAFVAPGAPSSARKPPTPFTPT